MLLLIPNSDLDARFCSKLSRENDCRYQTASSQLKQLPMQKWIHPTIELLAAKRFGITTMSVKLGTAKLCLENQNKTYRDQGYPKAFPQTWVKLSCSLAQITPDNKQRFNTHSVSLARAWANECRWVFSSNTVQRPQKPRSCFCANCKLDSSLDEIPKSDPLRIKSFRWNVSKNFK